MNVSIVGDSISTYAGYNPPGYSVYYDDLKAELNGISSPYDTWWANVNQFLKAYLCVNNSFSGSRVTGDRFPSTGCMERVSKLHTDKNYPDIILIFAGLNDYGYGEPVWDDFGFFYSYEKMLFSIQKAYPRAWVFCGTLMKSHLKDNSAWLYPEKLNGIDFDDYNEAIRKACDRQGCILADLASKNRTYESLDGSHPTIKGHKTIADCWISCLKRS